MTIPARVWRGGIFQRVLLIGGVLGLWLGLLAWLDSGFPLVGVVVCVITGTTYGIWMARRMARFWPGAKDLSADSRVLVANMTRSGGQITDVRLAQPVIDYRDGLHASADHARPFRWLIPLVLVVGVATTAWDAVFGSWGNLVSSAIYLGALLAEVFWWPRRQQEILDNADRAADMAKSTLKID